jgi:hypothetical protein
MIHQLIFASPRPGMSEAEFQDYWRYEHAIKFAAKIPQIRKYKVDSRVDVPGQGREIGYSGVAEIWIANEQDQIDSLKTPEYLLGARLDEPNWAASWLTLVLDTDSHIIVEGSEGNKEVPEYKIMLLIKKKREISLESFRASLNGDFSDKAKHLPGLTRFLIGTTRDRFYVDGGEPGFDAAIHLCANSLLELKAMYTDSFIQDTLYPQLATLANPTGILSIGVRSEWIIGPEARPYPIA